MSILTSKVDILTIEIVFFPTQIEEDCDLWSSENKDDLTVVAYATSTHSIEDEESSTENEDEDMSDAEEQTEPYSSECNYCLAEIFPFPSLNTHPRHFRSYFRTLTRVTEVQSADPRRLVATLPSRRIRMRYLR